MSEIKHCHILGPFNSGTVLAACYLRQLFSNFKPKRLNCWKHSLPPDFYREDSPQNAFQAPPEGFPGVLFVCMVRSPYFWATSTCRRPYALGFRSRDKDLADRLRCPVWFKGKRYKNIVQLWNHYYYSYAEQLEVNNSAEYVRLEDLVRHPVRTLQILENRLQRRPGSDLKKIIKQVSAVPSKPNNAYGAVWEEKNRLDHLLKSISKHDLAFVTRQLDRELMQIAE